MNFNASSLRSILKCAVAMETLKSIFFKILFVTTILTSLSHLEAKLLRMRIKLWWCHVYFRGSFLLPFVTKFDFKEMIIEDVNTDVILKIATLYSVFSS